MDGFYGLMIAKEHQDELRREVTEWRLAQSLRKARRANADSRAESSHGSGIVVRWGFAEDESGIAELLDLNGMPRWLAFEERFLVAEAYGRVAGALSYRTESKRLVLRELVADPWAGEQRLAWALYAGARRLGREIGVNEILAAKMPHADYLREAGYRRWRGSVWRLDAARYPETGPSEYRGSRRSLAALSGMFLRVLGWR